MSDSSPNECSTPVTSSHSRQRSNRLASTEAEYPVHHNRIGSKSIIEADRGDKETFVIDKQIPDTDMSRIDDSSPHQVSDNVFIKDPETAEDSVVSSRNKTRIVSEPFDRHEFEGQDNGSEETFMQHTVDPDSPFRNAGTNLSGDKKHRTAWAQPHMINPADFPVVKDSQTSMVIERNSREPYSDSSGILDNAEPITGGFSKDNRVPEPSTVFMNSPVHQEGHFQPTPHDPGLSVRDYSRQQLADVNIDSPSERGIALMIPVDQELSPEGDNLLNVGEDLEIGLSVRITHY